MQKFYSLCFFLFSFSLFASNSLELELEETKKKLNKLSIGISDMGVAIDSEQEKYFSFLDMEKKLRASLSLLENKMLEQQKETLSKEIKAKHLLLTLESLREDEPSVKSLIKYRVEKERILSKLKEFKQNSTNLEEMLKERQQVLSDLNDISSEKNIIHQIILDLESKKRDMVSKREYQIIKEANDIRKLESMKRKMRLIESKAKLGNQNVSFTFPLKNAVDFIKKSPGVDIFYEGSKSIYAPANGEVIYVSDLSSYGRVLIIKHSQNLRTVLLGRLGLTVKKGDKVLKNTVLGTALSNEKKLGKLYFELRVKDRPTKLSKYFNLSKNL